MVKRPILNLFDFQEKAVMELLDISTNINSKQTVIVKAPTGSGKTIMLIGFIEEYLNKLNKNTAFIWLCPGKGNLEEQSRLKMKMFMPHRNTQNLFEALNNGFENESITYINWELVTKKGNTAIREGEKKNLYDRISEAHRNGTDFIVIIDEEHSNNTAKAKDIIDHFSASRIIRASATATMNRRYEYIEIDELDVIDAGLITKALYVNEGIEDNMDITNEYECLLDFADKKRKAIAARYREILPAENIVRPLVLIQFPNGEPETIKSVEEKLAEMGYTYENGMVSIWMSDDKKNLPANITENSATPAFLLMKQAISTGWDCPRAKILVKLREGMSEQFEIQTIGRIRRMPEAKHYNDDLLDFCYVYTFDDEFKAGLLNQDKVYETRRLFLKEKCKTFTLEKQYRDLDFYGMGEREILQRIYSMLLKKYHLGCDTAENRNKLVSSGYKIGNELYNKALYGIYTKIDMLKESKDFYTTRQKVNTHKNGIQLLHSTDSIKRALGIKTVAVKTILERLFRKGGNKKNKLLELDTEEFYAFVINNEFLLRDDFSKAKTRIAEQQNLLITPKKGVFKLPEQDFFKYDTNVKEDVEYLSNAYREYTAGYVTSLVRSNSEQLFEQYCETRDDIDWVYKNGDTGQQYFSIVYVDGLQNQWLFYADYIVMKKDGTVWVIETKGGESKGKDKNIDAQIENKFNAFKIYAKNHGLHWGFVRDKDNRLYINNTEFVKDMSNDKWQPIGKVF